MNDTNSIKKIDLNKTDWRSSREFFESLVKELEKLDDRDEKYDFTWVGKRKAILEAGAPINKTLRPDVKSSKNWDTTENLFIEGDNLDALKLLQESYLGKVKLIYIDPPYNTGKDFVYHDNFKASTGEYDEDTEYKDEEGNIQYKKNEKSNGRYHSDWLSMMSPRLKLARNLLADNGVIFISIDDNEVENLKRLCNEIFGEENFIAQVVRVAKTTSFRGNFFAPSKDYVLCVAKNIFSLNKFSDTVIESQYTKIEEIGPRKGELYRDDTAFYLTTLETRPNQRYFVECPDGTLVIPPGKTYPPQKPTDGDGVWRWNRDTFEEKKDLIVFKKTNRSPLSDKDGNQAKWNLYTKTYLNDKLEHGNIPRDFFEGYLNRNGSEILGELNIPFDFPKPIELIKYLIKIIGSTSNSIILDFFAGSGTTAHAVMQLNAEDDGDRKWIMVQLPEETPEGSESRTAGFNTIPEIARERIRRAGDKIAKEHPDANVDYGFRSLVIADTNYKQVYKPVSEYKQESLLDGVDNIKENRSDLDLLFGVLTQLALELNRPIETREIEESTVYLYDYLGEVSGIVACFSEQISDEAIKLIANLKPLTAVFRESSFADSQAKVNLAEHFRVLSPDTKVRVI